MPQLRFQDARELARIILEDEAVKKGNAHVGKHIAYASLGKWLRGSDRVERVYASVRLFMRARLLQSDACREVAKILGPRLGKSKRGRPAKNPQRRKQKHEIVRSMFNSFARRNPWPPSEDSASFVDSRAENWYQHAVIIREWKKGILATYPRNWKSTPIERMQTLDGEVWRISFKETLPGPDKRR